MTSRKLIIHVICWILFIVYEVSITLYVGGKASILEFAFFYALGISLFYFNAHCIFDKISPKRNSIQKFLVLIFFILSELIVYTYLSIILYNAFSRIKGYDLFTLITINGVVRSIWRGVYFLGISIAYWAVLKTIKAARDSRKAEVNQLKIATEKERLEKENVKLQNAYLQARINPHFLFNTLNFIFNQAEEGHADTSKNIALLSDIMQYSLCSADIDGKVPLYQEIGHIKRFIELNQSRFDNRLYLKDEVTHIYEKDHRIPPLLLLTFVENVFKHGDMTDINQPAIIRINYCNGKLLLYTENKKRRYRADRGEHVGIKNAKRRLKNYYRKEDVDLSIEDTEAKFILNLKIIV